MRIIIKPGGQLRYRYTAGGCMDFDLTTLAEVGEPYQPAAMALLNELKAEGYEIHHSVNLVVAPWVADIATKKATSCPSPTTMKPTS